ncbi:MAG: hypothetical protein N4A38_03950 [Candidatus Gracilibacteria bacterium]|nr:hypothetical protein [Candidatus Gracilibacteria bacterium]
MGEKREVKHVNYNGEKINLPENNNFSDFQPIDNKDNLVLKLSKKFEYNKKNILAKDVFKTGFVNKRENLSEEKNTYLAQLSKITQEGTDKLNKEVRKIEEEFQEVQRLRRLEWRKSLTGLEAFYENFGKVIQILSENLGFTEEYLLAVISLETIFNIEGDKKQSKRGSLGYMQLTSIPFKDMVRRYKKDKNGKEDKQNYYGRGRYDYLPVFKRIPDSLINMVENQEGKNLLIRLKEIDPNNKNDLPEYKQIANKLRRILKNKETVEQNSVLNIIMGGVYLKVVHDTLGTHNVYGKKQWYKPFLKLKIDTINSWLEYRGCKISEEELNDFKYKMENKKFSEKELRLLLATRIYNGDGNIETPGVEHKYYYGATTYFLEQYLYKQKHKYDK